VEEGFEVLSCTSSDQRVQVFGALAVFTHGIATRLRTAAGDEETRERETIVFALQDDGAWLAVHEHVSPAPPS
jgi:ketosteroid isomerase-like protein